MKLTATQVEAKATEAWGTQASVIPYRISGNRTAYAVTDHGDHWLPLNTPWNGDGQVLEPIGTTWPWEERDIWVDAVLDAVQLALAYFTKEGDRAAVKRLPRAQTIAEGRTWRRIGDRFDTWLMPIRTRLGIVYIIEGTHPDSGTVAQ
jgi:hypothetical protein